MVASTILVPKIGNAALADTDVIAYWSCDETSGVRYDSTDNSHDLTDNNTVGYGTGTSTNACDFTRGETEYLTHTTTVSENWPTASFSTTFSLNPESLTNGQYYTLINRDGNAANNTRSFAIRYQYVGGAYKFHVELYPTGYNGSNYYSGEYTYQLNTATWYHVAIVVDTSKTYTQKVYLYINGVGQGYFTATNGTNDPSTIQDVNNIDMTIGYASWTGAYDGLLDEIAIWNKALTSSEVLTLSQGDIWPFTTSTTTSTSTTSTTTSSVDVEELKWVLELYLSVFTFLIFTYVGYRFTKMFI